MTRVGHPLRQGRAAASARRWERFVARCFRVEVRLRRLERAAQGREGIARGLDDTAQLTGSLANILSTDKGLLNATLQTLHPTLDVISKEQQHVDAALSWIGPGGLALAKATVHGPWADIYVRSVGPDIPGILCGVIHPPNQPCPT